MSGQAAVPARVARPFGPAPAERVVRCRMLNKLDDRCTGEAVDPDGPLIICTRHLAEAMEMLKGALGSPR